MAYACANETKLSEYTHIEAELDFITFDDLLAHLEHLICRVIDLTLENPIAVNGIKTYNPEFTKPSRPFLRMRYSEAIDWLRAKGIKTEDGNGHVFGDDIAEAAQRKMTNEINRPIFLTYFPVEIKSFCMQRAENDKRVTEPIDVLMPGVGEIVGGSMRTWDYDELMAAYKLKTSTRPATFGTWISLSTVLHPTEVRARWRKVLGVAYAPLDCARSMRVPSLHRQVHTLMGNQD